MKETRNKMHPIDLFARLNELMPSEGKLLTFGVVNKEISSIGVCVNPTTHVIDKAMRKGIDVLISHNQPTSNGETKAKSNRIYGLAINQYIPEQTRIFADIFGLENIEDITIRYDGKKITNSTIVGSFKTQIIEERVNIALGLGNCNFKNVKRKVHAGDYVLEGIHIGEYFVEPLYLGFDLEDTVRKMRLDLKEFNARSRITSDEPTYMRKVQKACLSILNNTKEVIEQTRERHDIDTYIGMDMTHREIIFAQEFGVNVINLDDYSSKAPGMMNLAKTLNAEFIPNHD